MSILDSAVEHFSSKKIRAIEVPEWGVKLFAKNLTLDDKSKMLSRSSGNSADYMVYAVIFGALNEKGDPVFTLEDKSALKTKVDPEVLSRVANFILDGSKNEEQREKN